MFKPIFFPRSPFKPRPVLTHTSLWLCSAALLSACGGGSSGGNSTDGNYSSSDSSLPAQVQAELAQAIVQPSFHMLPVEFLAELSTAKHLTDSISLHDDAATPGMDTITIPAEHSETDTYQLTLEKLHDLNQAQANAPKDLSLAQKNARAHTPTSIRAAYGLTPVPSTIPAQQRAQFGAGQTIYVIAAYHYNNVVSDLNAFSRGYGLPTCTSVSIPVTTSLPLPSANPDDGCTVSVVYNTSNGTITSTQPRYNAMWASEIALDVQWAHAIAPLARIVLIEAADASLMSILGSIQLANKMGPGLVSMSFSAPEGSWTPYIDQYFSVPGMIYAAASGNAGPQVNWPAVSPRVLAVGGTSLYSYTSTTNRSETLWTSTGGGVSLYQNRPSYQQGVKFPSWASSTRRATNDVSFNANPYTGQYVFLTLPGSPSKWAVFGGTSIATPQWVGILAVANAMRQAAGTPPITDVHTALYKTVQSNYTSNFFDITSGYQGRCLKCTATMGYDIPSGLGTPKAGTLIPTLVAQ